jgi:hypothetical protein
MHAQQSLQNYLLARFGDVAHDFLELRSGTAKPATLESAEAAGCELNTTVQA